MKKALTLSLVMLLFIGTKVAFAQPESEAIKLTQELIRIDSDLALTFGSILSGCYDTDKLKKDVNFSRTRLSSVLNRAHNASKEMDYILEKRELERLHHIASGHMLSTNGVIIYLEDPINNHMFLFDAITHRQQQYTHLKGGSNR